MKYLRYKGEFLSVAGVIWRAEIWQESETEFGVVGGLDFDGDEPLMIEWDSKSKEDVICGSSVQLKVISPGDRTYEDLYSIEVGHVRLDLYRNDKLYWSGCMDSEFYEEPYEAFNGYTVTLTFTDFGVLDRLKYELQGMQSVYDVISYCIERCGINIEGVDTGCISTQLNESSGCLTLSEVNVHSTNFYDEEDEPLTLAEVMKGILQPLALRVIQRCGRVYVYDLNGLCISAGRKQIEWAGESQTLSTDAVYNNISISWSPYVREGNLLPEECWGGVRTESHLTNLNSIRWESYEDAHYMSFSCSTDKKNWTNKNSCGFTIWTTYQGINAEIGEQARYFKIIPQYVNEDSEGVALYIKAEQYKDGISETEDYGYKEFFEGGTDDIGECIFKSSSVYLPPVKDDAKLNIRISVELLAALVYNPFYDDFAKDFEDAHTDTENYQLEYAAKHWYVPFKVKFQPSGSDTVYVWNNWDVVYRYKRFVVGEKEPGFDADDESDITAFSESTGKWELCTELDDNMQGYLMYKEFGSWVCNRQAINPHDKTLDTALNEVADGQYIPYPKDGGGVLWIEIYSKGWLTNAKCITDVDDSFAEDYMATQENGHLELHAWNCKKRVASNLRWVLMKMPEIEVVDADFNKVLNTDDIEYQAQINSNAKETLELKTICGTYQNGVLAASGVYYDNDSIQITEFYRAGRTTQVENLLIGTIYSQYAQRHVCFCGDTQILSHAITAYTERNQGNKLFLLRGEVQDVRMDISDADIVEVSPDNYKCDNE